MNNHLTVENLMRVLPAALQNDAAMIKLGLTAAEALIGLSASADLPVIYARIDMLPEWLLDILAVDFKVDWYIKDADLTSKRALIKDCFYVHKHRGTRAALNRGIYDIRPDSTVEEWYEYGGEPYRFRLTLKGLISATAADSVMQVVRRVKNARSALDTILFWEQLDAEQIYVGNALRFDGTCTIQAGEYDAPSEDYLTDEDGVMLLDENYRVLY